MRILEIFHLGEHCPRIAVAGALEDILVFGTARGPIKHSHSSRHRETSVDACSVEISSDRQLCWNVSFSGKGSCS